MLTLPPDFAAAHDWLAHRLDTVRVPASGDVRADGGTTPAAVLVPLVFHPDGPTVLFTRRTERLAKHAGQVSFPGGRMEAGESPEAAALRETEEEVGIAGRFITPVGRLAHYHTISRYQVTPVVALLRPGFALRLQADEVAEAFEVPLGIALDRRQYRERDIEVIQPNGMRLKVRRPALDWQGRIIWGATAGMLDMLHRTLLDEPTS